MEAGLSKTVLIYVIFIRWEAMALTIIYVLLFSYEAKQHDENFQVDNH